jgi:hypothetical protein
LPAPALHGTFAKAYSLLTRLATKVGWDDLLRFRSAVFVMEEEYRMQKAQEEKRKTDVPGQSEADKSQPENASQPSEEAKEAVEETKAEGDDETAEAAEKLENVTLDTSDSNSKPIDVSHEQLEKPQQAAEETKVGSSVITITIMGSYLKNVEN